MCTLYTDSIRIRRCQAYDNQALKTCLLFWQSDLYWGLQRENDTLAKEVDESKGVVAEQAGLIEALRASLAEEKKTLDDLRKACIYL